MDFQKDIQLVLDREGIEAIKRYASVSTQHNCNCGNCFYCACLDYAHKKGYFLTLDEKREKYDRGEYLFGAAPVCTALWDRDAWIKWIDAGGRWK